MSQKHDCSYYKYDYTQRFSVVADPFFATVHNCAALLVEVLCLGGHRGRHDRFADLTVALVQHLERLGRADEVAFGCVRYETIELPRHELGPRPAGGALRVRCRLAPPRPSRAAARDGEHVQARRRGRAAQPLERAERHEQRARQVEGWRDEEQR